uniref:DUF936 domain-containing protein n=1 Tax=Leersia perrieri TaxID=77586 RepID=A0A0D9VNM8_9ORYZ
MTNLPLSQFLPLPTACSLPCTPPPGVLLKLLQAMHTDDRVAGDHRSPVLQPPNGGFLQLSNGLHSTYVQLDAHDADALVTARPHLVGHLLHLDRLRFARPVPRAVGIHPIPSSSQAVPFVGTPEPLVARPVVCSRGYVIQSVSHFDAAPPLMPSNSGNDAVAAAVKRAVLAPKTSPARSGGPTPHRTPARRCRLASPREIWNPAAIASPRRTPGAAPPEEPPTAPALASSPLRLTLLLLRPRRPSPLPPLSASRLTPPMPTPEEDDVTPSTLPPSGSKGKSAEARVRGPGLVSPAPVKSPWPPAVATTCSFNSSAKREEEREEGRQRTPRRAVFQAGQWSQISDLFPFAGWLGHLYTICFPPGIAI